jgi:hypothetical protein
MYSIDLARFVPSTRSVAGGCPIVDGAWVNPQALQSVLATG